MRESVTIRNAVEKARRKHEAIAADRVLGQGRLGDEELTDLLIVSYPTVAGQRN